MNKSILWVVVVAGALACGGSVDELEGEGGTGGVAGTGGAAGTGATGGTGGAETGGSGGLAGNAGSAGSAGSAATAGQAGSGGGAGQAGMGGTGGSAGASGEAWAAGSAGSVADPECTDASQCTLFSDCCSCIALAPGETVEPCPALCFVDKCTELGIDPMKTPECQAGQCVVGFDCDATKAVCAMPPPQCEPGEVPSVRGGCWGPCVPAAECTFVPDCSDCDPTLHTCVSNVAWTTDHHCVPTPPACKDDSSCSCLQNAVCVDPFGVCVDSPSGGISCECPNC
jgi:hypothetical protein